MVHFLKRRVNVCDPGHTSVSLPDGRQVSISISPTYFRTHNLTHFPKQYPSPPIFFVLDEDREGKDTATKGGTLPTYDRQVVGRKPFYVEEARDTNSIVTQLPSY